jgi:hypothetical protein
MVTAKGEMKYSITEQHIQSERYIEFWVFAEECG